MFLLLGGQLFKAEMQSTQFLNNAIVQILDFRLFF